MKNLIVSLFGLLFITFTLSANTLLSESDLVGSWNFNVKQAPWEYSKGNMVFEVLEDEVLSGKMKFINGVEARIINITREDEKIAFEITAEGYRIKTVVKLKDNDIDGFVETPEGNLPFSAKREIPED